MSGNDANLTIGVSLLKAYVDPAKPLEDRLRATMKASRQEIWFSTDADLLMRCAIGAVLLSASEEERARITAELDNLRSLSALMSGVPVDVGQMVARLEAQQEPVGLIKIWRETESR